MTSVPTLTGIFIKNINIYGIFKLAHTEQIEWLWQ